MLPDALYTAVVVVALDDDRSIIRSILFDLHYLLEAAGPVLMSFSHIDADELHFLVHIFVFKIYFEPEKFIWADIGRTIDE